MPSNPFVHVGLLFSLSILSLSSLNKERAKPSSTFGQSRPFALKLCFGFLTIAQQTKCSSQFFVVVLWCSKRIILCLWGEMRGSRAGAPPVVDWYSRGASSLVCNGTRSGNRRETGSASWNVPFVYFLTCSQYFFLQRLSLPIFPRVDGVGYFCFSSPCLDIRWVNTCARLRDECMHSDLLFFYCLV